MSDRLWFERLDLERLPGLERGGFTLDGLSPGVNVIHGPNGSGKTTTARAIHALLWPESGAAAGRRLRATLRIGGEPWEIELDHDRQLYRTDGERADRPALPPADVSDRYHLTLQDLLATEGVGGASGQRFARQIAEELAGGFDFEAAREALGARATAGRPLKLMERYRAAKARVREVAEAQQRLLEEEADLDLVRRELEASRDAARELEGVEARLAWLDARAAAEEAGRRLASFSPAVERLKGEESEQAAALEDRARRERDAVEQTRQRIAVEERRRDAARLPPDGVSDELLEELRRRSETLERLEDRLGREAERLARGEERRERSRRGLLTGSPGAGREPLPLVTEPDLEEPDLPAWKAVVDLARRWEIHRGETAQELRLEEWIGGVETAAVAERLDRLRDATRILRRWLRRPGGAWGPRLPALSAALALVGTGVGAVLTGLTGFDTGLPEVGPWWGGGLIATGVIVLLWSLLERRSARRQRAELTVEYEGLRRDDDLLAAPPSWSTAEVAALLDDLERQLAEGRLEEEKALRWRGLRERRQGLAARGAALEKERDALLERLGAVPDLGSEVDPAPLASFVEALSVWREATVEVAEAEAARSDLEGERVRVLERIGRDFEHLGDARPADAIEAASRVAVLGDRAGEHRRAREALAALGGPEGELARAESRLRETEEELAGLYRQLDLEPLDRAGLSTLLEQLDGFRAARDEAGEARWRMSEAEDALARLGLSPPAGDAETRDRGALDAERQHLVAEAGQVEDLIRRIQDLETRIRTARGGHDLEDALADLDLAERSLLRARAEEARKVAAWQLVAWLRGAAGRSHRPAVLRTASDLFTRFTRGRYRLLDPQGDPPVFRARESDTGLVRRLDELSAGTRVQLLIAVRLAFAESQERGLRLPLVLDETLANSDEWSAEAVMNALLEVAGPAGGSDGRQIVYFTAQQDEVAKWRVALASDFAPSHSRIIDLAEVRRREEVEERPWAEIDRTRQQVPAPNGMNREEYARALGVPGIDPWQGVGALHLWYVIDDLEVLHRVMRAGPDRWGRLAALLESGHGSALLGSGKRAERCAVSAAARAQCVDAIAKAWRQGRGRRLDRGVLIASRKVSDIFIDEVSDLAASLNGDAARLIEALRAGEVKRFQTAKIEELEEFLAEQGSLDERPVLDREEILARALRSVSREIDSGDLTFRDVEDLLARVLS